MDTKKRDKEEARGSALLTKMLGALVIAGLVVMAVLVGTASANGNATIEGKNETVGYDEAININDLLTLLKLLTPGNYDLLLDMHEAGGYDIGGDIGDSSQRTQIKDSNLNFMVSESSGPEIDVTKTVSPAVVTPGTNVTFTITVTNTYDCILKPVKVVDILAEGLSYLHDDSGGKESPERTITWDDITGGLGLEPEEAITITFVAHIDEDATGPLTDIVTATGTPQEDFSDSDEVAVDVLLPDISVTKTASPTEGVPGTDVTFTLEVRNIGNCILDPVRVVDTLPAGMSYVSANSNGIESSKGIITWTNVGPLNSTEGTTISLVARIDTGASSPLIDNVTVWGTPPAGEDVTDYDTADVVVLAPDISVTKTASPTVGTPGTDVTFTLEVRNIGNCILDPVRVVDTLPAGMSYVSADSGGNESSKGIITWTNVGPLNSTEGTTISLVAHIDTGASSPLIDNVTVWGTPPAGEDVTDYDTADVVVLAPDISVTKTASPTVGTPGTDVTFTLEVRNIGNCILDPVRVVDTLPAGMSYVSADSGGNESSKGIITWTNVGPLNSTEGTTISLVAHIDTGASSPLIDNVTVWGTPPAGEDVTDYDTADVVVLAPDISVTKTASPTVGTPGTDVTFTLEVRNIGNCILDPVRVVDTLPAGMSYVSADSGGNESSKGIITWTNVGPLNSTEGTTISLVARIDTGASSPLIDNVTVWGTPPAGEDVTDYDTAVVMVSGIITPSPTMPPGTIPPGTMPPGTIPPTGEYPPTQVPVFTSIGLIALMGLLSVIAMMTLKRRK